MSNKPSLGKYKNLLNSLFRYAICNFFPTNDRYKTKQKYVIRNEVTATTNSLTRNQQHPNWRHCNYFLHWLKLLVKKVKYEGPVRKIESVKKISEHCIVISPSRRKYTALYIICRFIYTLYVKVKFNSV